MLFDDNLNYELFPNTSEHLDALYFRDLKKKMIGLGKSNLTKKNSLIFILTFTGIAVLDSTIVSFSSFSGFELPTWMNIVVFLIFSTLFMIMSTILISSVRRLSPKQFHNKVAPIAPKYFYFIVSLTLILTAVIVGTIILQMFIMNEYNIFFLKVQTYLSHISPLLFILFLIFLFYGWLTSSNRNYVVLLYSISFSLVCINLLVSLAYLVSYFSHAFVPYVKPDPLIAYVNNILGGPFTESLSIAYDILSLASFTVTWVATTVLLGQYRRRIGTAKYFLLMSIPLIYYVLPLSDYFREMFFSLVASSPVAFNIMYLLIFSATQQVAALLFSLSFWTASSLVHDDRLRKSLLMSSIGMAILFGSIELTPLQFRVYPPYGLITEAFIPLGAYLLFIGIYTSAKYISQDAELRKKFYKSAETQLGLLKTIGVSEMEKELENKVKFVVEHSSISPDTDDSEVQEENVQEIMRDVLNELYSKKNKEDIQGS